MTTVKAPFGGWIPLVNLDDGSSIPLCFVLQLPAQFTPSYIRDGFSQAVVFDHILDLQTLEAYDLVFAYDASRELVVIVSPSIGYLLMDARNLETGFYAVLGTFFLLGMTTLRFCQLLFILGEEFGVAIGVTIRGDDHRLQAQVKPNRRRCDFQWLDILFYQDGDKVAFSFIFGDGDAAWLASVRQWAVPRDVKRGIHFCQRKSLALPDEGIARVYGGLLVALLFEGGIVCPSIKEVTKGFIQISESLLQGDRRNIVKPCRFFLFLERLV